VLPAVVVGLILLLAIPATAGAVVTVSEDASSITVTGTNGDDAVVVKDDGANVYFEPATAGANCTQSLSAALCPRGNRTIGGDLGDGSDDFDSSSVAEATIAGGNGADLLRGRLRSAAGGAGKDILRPFGMTGTVTLTGGDDVDLYDLGADAGAADVVVDTNRSIVDYLSRPAGSGGVTVTASDATANDGGASEGDNVGTSAVIIRGTVNADTITGTAGTTDILDGDLGADTLDGGDDQPTGSFGGATVRGDLVAFELDSRMPYARPTATARTTGVTVDLAAGTSSDGDTLLRIDDARGTAFDDVLKGSASRDVLEGGPGMGADQVSGGADSDVAGCELGVGGTLVEIALVAADHNGTGLSTSSDCKLIFDGGDGNDLATGGSGVDNLRGATGDDSLNGGAGDDLITGGPGTDALQGSTGTDTISFADDTAGVDVSLAAGSGQEAAGGNFENVVGSPFNDTISGNGAPNALNGGAGTDTISYAGRTTAMAVNLTAGTASADGVAEDTLANFENAIGGSGNDTLIGTTSANLLRGEDGNDRLLGDLGADFFVGGNGEDTLSFDYLAPPGVGITHTLGGTASSNSESDVSLEIENLSGSRRDDVLIGTTGPNSLTGEDGDDRLTPLGGADRLRGNAGTDTIDYSPSPVAIHAHLNAIGGLRVREFATTPTDDVLVDQIENVLGSPFADVLRGSDGVNTLRGNGGNDVIDGRKGDDTLDGGGGNDRFGTIAGSVDETATAAQVTAGNGSSDGRDTVLGGSGNDDVNVRDAFLDARIDCGSGTDIARQDLVDDDGDLDIDNCETIETTAIDQLMTIVRRVARRGARATLECPRRSKVVCRGTAGRARSAAGTPRVLTRYSIRRGARRTIRVRGSGRYLILRERDQRGRVRRLSRRV